MIFNKAAEKPDDKPRQNRKTKTPEQRIAELKTKESQLQKRIKREQAKLSQAKRKEDTRRKIIAGAIALEHMDYDQDFADKMRSLIAKHVKDSDKALFDL